MTDTVSTKFTQVIDLVAAVKERLAARDSIEGELEQVRQLLNETSRLTLMAPAAAAERSKRAKTKMRPRKPVHRTGLPYQRPGVEKVLTVLRTAANNKPLRLCEIIPKAGIPKGSVYGALAWLKARGLVRKDGMAWSVKPGTTPHKGPEFEKVWDGSKHELPRASA